MFKCEPDHTILICSKCQGVGAASKLRATLKGEIPNGYTFRAVDCMAGCDNPITVGFQAAGKATYLFGDIESADDIAGIGAFAHQYQASRNGWTSSKERPKALSGKTIARLPALNRGADYE